MQCTGPKFYDYFSNSYSHIPLLVISLAVAIAINIGVIYLLVSLGRKHVLRNNIMISQLPDIETKGEDGKITLQPRIDLI